MAWQQWRQLANGEVQSSDDATWVLELPTSNVIHSLWLKTEITNGATSAQDLDISDVVDLVEVIANGSEVLVSLSATELEKWGMITLGKPVPEVRDERGGQKQMAMYPILFGRTLFDPEYWLPANAFADLELRVRYSPTIGATAFATGTTTFTVIALLTMGGTYGTYRGTLKTTNVSTFTTAASGEEVIDLPRRNVYRRILISAYEAGVADGTAITAVKFDVNNGERVYLNMDWDNLAELNHTWFGLYPELHAVLFRSDGDVVYTRIGNIVSAQLLPFVDVDIANDTFVLDRIDTISGDALTINSSQGDITAGAEDLTAYTTDHNMLLHVTGRGLPFATVVDLDFLTGGEAFDSSKWDQVQLTLTQGGAGATVRVSLQEVINVR